MSVVFEGGRLGLKETSVFFLRCLDSKEIPTTASQFQPVRCQQTMFMPRNISRRFQEEFRRRGIPQTEKAFNLAVTLNF